MKSLFSIFTLFVPLCTLAQTPTTYGSGFAVTNNYVVTNFHTINGSDGILVSGIKGNTSVGYVAKVVATDAPNDIALLKITDAKFTGFGAMPYNLKANNESIGTDVCAVGYGSLKATDTKYQTLKGKITDTSGIGGNKNHFQTNMTTQVGHSGSPIINSNGDVIGIVVSYVHNGKSINFATKSNMINKLLTSKQITIPASTTLKSLKAEQRGSKMSSVTCIVMCFKGGVGSVDNFIKAKAENNEVSNIVNGHECVDLGLSVRWATCNLGANKPEDFGNFFSWGEVKTKNNFSPGDYAYSKSFADTWVNIGTDIKNTKYDVAKAILGNDWRLPTATEARELLEKCKWEWIDINGKSGFKVTGPNGKSIFLPAAGIKMLDETYYENSYGYYWTSTLNTADAGNAYNLYFFSTYRGIDSIRRYFGHMVRGVTK